TAVTDHRPIVGEDNESLQFTQPLDVAVHPSGRIYLADFGEWKSFGKGGAIWALTELPEARASGLRKGKKVTFPAKGLADGVRATLGVLESCHSSGAGHAVADFQAAQEGDHVRLVFARPV